MPAAAPKRFRIRPIGPDDWPVIEDLFGTNGACAGCWCMFWRVTDRKQFQALQGPKAKAAFRKLVRAGEASGLLAFDGELPVGWCALGPRAVFPHTERMRSYVVPDADRVWSINCFFIRRSHRRCGLAGQLLAAAVGAARKAGARALEGYPSVPKPGSKQADAFLYKGTLSLFERQGFRETQRLYPGSPLVRIDLSRKRAR